MDINTVAIFLTVISFILLVVAIIKLASLSQSVKRLSEQIPGTGMTAKELAQELGGSIESSFQRFVPQPDKISSSITASVEASLKAALGSIEGMHKKLLDAQDSVLDKWSAHEKTAVGGLDGIRKSLDGASHNLTSQLEAAFKSHADRVTQANSQLASQLEKIAALEKEVEKLIRLQVNTDGIVKAMAASEEFKDLVKSLRTHLEASDKLLKEVSKPRSIKLVEQQG